MVGKLAGVARILFGFSLLLNGLNWWWKVLPYPTLGDPPNAHTPHFVQAMIDTGFLFDAIKIVEVVTGIALLANLFVPLALVVAFPIAVAAWAVDIGLLGTSSRALVMGWSVLLLNVFLLIAYVDRYLPIFAPRARGGAFWDEFGERK